MEEKLFEIASRVTKPVSLAALVVAVFYLVLRALFSLPVFSDLGESATFALLSTIAERLFYLALVALVLGVGSYSFLRYRKGEAERAQAQPRPTGWAITGNVFLSNGKPVRGATVFVEGIDRQKETDASGWFSIDVNEQRTWIVHALYKDELAERVVRRANIARPVRLMLRPVREAENTAQSLQHDANPPPKDDIAPLADPVPFLNPIKRYLDGEPAPIIPQLFPIGLLPPVSDADQVPKVVVAKVEYLVTVSGRTYEYSLKLLNSLSESAP